jgi:hypothetical protein
MPQHSWLSSWPISIHGSKHGRCPAYQSGIVQLQNMLLIISVAHDFPDSYRKLEVFDV